MHTPHNKWDVSRFKEVLNEESAPIIQKQQTEKIVPSETVDTIGKTTHQDSAPENNEKVASETEDKNMQEADFYDFLDYLDELDTEEIAKLFENLDLEEDEKEALTELTEQETENTENIQPSMMIVEMMESGVASLADLIKLVEETKTVLLESVQERFEPVLQTLQTMQANGGALIFHRPPADTDNFMLYWINPSPSQRQQLDLDAANLIHEIPSDDPSKPSLFLHKGNSIIID